MRFILLSGFVYSNSLKMNSTAVKHLALRLLLTKKITPMIAPFHKLRILVIGSLAQVLSLKIVIGSLVKKDF